MSLHVKQICMCVISMGYFLEGGGSFTEPLNG